MGSSKKPKAVPVQKKSKKLSNKDKEALIELPKQIEKMEAERDQITCGHAESRIIIETRRVIHLGIRQTWRKLEVQIASSYSRWEELEAIAE